jgi:hypothetical protein
VGRIKSGEDHAMRRTKYKSIVALAAGIMAAHISIVASAFPSRGSGCASCHNSAGGLALSISPNPIDIKKGNHSLLTFLVTSMGNASNANISVQGLQNAALNATVNPPPAGDQWTLRTGSSGTSYMSNSITGTGPYTLDLGIGASATFGTYPIVVQFAGDGPVGISSNFNLTISPAGVPGDYNGNNIVDAADFVLWRNGGPLQNEVDAPGTVNAADYTAWRARFGNTSAVGSGLVTIAPVPEPATAVVAALGFLSFCLFLRKNRR